MQSFNYVVESPISDSIRCQQVSAMFDVPVQRTARLEFKGSLALDSEPWNIGLIVGPSGSGKTTIASRLWSSAYDKRLSWEAPSVIDDFSQAHSVQEISNVCSAVGFNTIPAWLRPYSVLSNGERFRVDLARRLLEHPDPIVVDEFSSVVDRQVAKIASHAVQKYIRKNNRQFVAISCHSDIIDWLQPDWVFEPAFSRFTRRRLRRRPTLECSIRCVSYKAWNLFAPFHYLSSELNKSARCFALYVKDQIVSFCGVLFKVGRHCKNKTIYGVSRVVTLPDWQGLGLAFALIDFLGSCYSTIGALLHIYPAHPSFIRSLDRSPNWACMTMPGHRRDGSHVSAAECKANAKPTRPCATFRYCGSAFDNVEFAKNLVMHKQVEAIADTIEVEEPLT